MLPVEQLTQNLLGAKLFQEAIALQNNQQKKAEIRKIYAKYLIENADYSKTVEQLILTIGYVEPSIVVKMFLEYGRTVELQHYLEELHQQTYAKQQQDNQNYEYSGLLMNCYVKNDDLQSLKTFIRQAEMIYINGIQPGKQPSRMFNVQQMIDNLVKSRLSDIAVEVAVLMGEELSAIDILVKNKKIEEAQKIMQLLPQNKLVQCIQQFGVELMNQQLQQMIYSLCTAKPVNVDPEQQSDPEYLKLYRTTRERQKQAYGQEEIKQIPMQDFLQIFISTESDKYLITLCIDLLNMNIQLSEQVIYTFFDSMFRNHQKSEQVLQLLKSVVQQNQPYDFYNMYILFTNYQAQECIIYLLTQQNLKFDAIKFYAKANNFDGAFMLFKQLDQKQQDQLYSTMLQLAVKQKDKNSKLQQLLEINRLDVSTTIDLLSNYDPELDIGCLFNYLKTQFQQMNEKTQVWSEDIMKKQRQIKLLQQSIDQLQQPLKFQHATCYKCNQVIEPPAVFCRCGHAYHERCWKLQGGQCSCQAQLQTEENNTKTLDDLILNEDDLEQFICQTKTELGK